MTIHCLVAICKNFLFKDLKLAHKVFDVVRDEYYGVIRNVLANRFKKKG